MHRHIRLPLLGLAAAAAFAIAASSASANRFSLSANTFRIVWSALRFEYTLGGTTPASCRVTLAGSFYETNIRKVQSAAIGDITTTEIILCSNASIFPEGAPWRLTYLSFAGMLPNITRVTFGVVGARMIINSNGQRCAMGTTTNEPAVFISEIGTNGRLINLVADTTRRIELTNPPEGGLCTLGRLILNGTGAVTRLNSTIELSIRLI